MFVKIYIIVEGIFMKLVLLLILAVLPVVLFIFYINSKDKQKEPKGLLAALFFSGFLACFLVVLISYIMSSIFPIFDLEVKSLDFLQLAIYVFIGVALVEELCKWLFTMLIGFRSKNFDETFDIIVYSTFVSLGFACIENVLYVVQGGFLSALLRAITSVPGHMCFGIIMGYYLLLAKLSKKNNNKKLYKKNIALSLVIPILAHGIYDYFLFLGNIFFLFVLLVLIILFFVYSHSKLKQVASVNRKIFYKNKYCPRCGVLVETPYCPHCGLKHE